MEEQRRVRMRDLFGSVTTAERCDESFAVYLDAYESAWAPYDDVHDTLDQLRNRRLGVITNGNNEQQRKKLERTGLAPRFSVVVTSGECGFAKPDRRIFMEACRRADVDPRRASFIGDDWARDVVGSREAGLQPIWLRREPSAAQPVLPGVRVIQTLHELGAVLAAEPLA